MRLRSLAALLVTACSAQQTPTGSHGLSTPVGLDAGVSLSKQKPAAAAAEVSIEQFQPLLAEPALAKAQKLVEAGSTQAAAREVESQMSKAQPAGREVLRWQMLLGRLREQAGDLTGAAASYELAAAEPWPLAGYATLGVGRIELRSGKVARAMEWLERVPKDQPAVTDARLLLAEAAVRAQKPDLAIDTWRSHLATQPAEATDIALRLSAALLDRAGTDRTKTNDLVEALALARRVEAENAGSMPILDRARRSTKRALDALPAKERSRYRDPSAEDELVRVRALLDAKLEAEAETVADKLLASFDKNARWGSIGCEASLLRGKAIAAKHDYARAADAVDEMLKRCRDGSRPAGARAVLGR